MTGGGAVAPGTGDSAIVRVRVLCGEGWATVIGVEAVPVAVHRDARGNLAVALMEHLAVTSSRRVAGVLPGTARGHRAAFRGGGHFFRAMSIASEISASRVAMRAPAAAALAREAA